MIAKWFLWRDHSLHAYFRQTEAKRRRGRRVDSLRVAVPSPRGKTFPRGEGTATRRLRVEREARSAKNSISPLFA